jgi:hypothetical protein
MEHGKLWLQQLYLGFGEHITDRTAAAGPGSLIPIDYRVKRLEIDLTPHFGMPGPMITVIETQQEV